MYLILKKQKFSNILFNFIFILFSLSVSCQADIVRFESNNFINKVPINWIGKLKSIDNYIAHFKYINNDKEIDYFIHISRIYSMEIDDQDQYNRSFPPCRAGDLKKELSGSNLFRMRKLELGRFTKTKLIRNDINYSEGYNCYTINGTIISVNEDDLNRKIVKLLAEKNDGEIIELEIKLDELKMWIR